MANLILNRPTCHLIIPDAHSTAGHNQRRFKWLGELITDLRPETVINIGDWADLTSLNSYDHSAKKAYEGQQYKKDINACLEAQELMFEPIRRQKRKLPRFVWCLGNHEDRITRAVESDPILKGTVGLEDLGGKDYGWETYPFLKQVEIDGIYYSHYHVTGVSGRPIPDAKNLLQKQFKSSTQGHSHLFDYCVRTDAEGNRLHGLIVGCYVEENLKWADATSHLWWSGVCVCRNVEQGQYDLQTISIKALKKAYGGG